MSNQFPSLREAYAKYFKIGAAVSPASIALYGDILEEHFNSLTADNAMKLEPMHPQKDVWEFRAADAVVSYAKTHGMAVRAHAPVWHKQVGLWMFRDDDGKPLSREALLARLEEHMQVFGKRYGGDVYCWDVINEAIAHFGNGVLRDSNWTELIGKDFLEQAFRIAKKCVPDSVQLFYNDYNEWMPHKREKLLQVLRELIEAGAPIDGFGMQQHLSIYADLDEIRRSVEAYAALGLRLHVTELDVSLYTVYETGRPTITDEMLQKQYDMYVELFSIYRQYADVIDSVTTWGVADSMTWLDSSAVRIGDFKPDDAPTQRKNFPLLFYADHRMRPYTEKIIEDALK